MVSSVNEMKIGRSNLEHTFCILQFDIYHFKGIIFFIALDVLEVQEMILLSFIESF